MSVRRAPGIHPNAESDILASGHRLPPSGSSSQRNILAEREAGGGVNLFIFEPGLLRERG